MAEAVLWGFVLRIVQSALQAAPFIFTGLCIAGILHRLMGRQYTRWLFGSNSFASLAQSWFLGMLLPGCSLGTIPIVRQLRVSAISVGTIFAFALSSPLFDPLSLLYGLTLSKPLTIVAFAFCSLIVVTLSGSIFDAMFPNTEVDTPEPPPSPFGIKRLLAVLVVMSREIVSVSGVYILIGLLGTGLLSLMLPAGSLQRTMAHDNPWSPLMMTGIAIPAYATPMMAMGQLGSMFQHGNSVGAAFILLVFGAGMNLGLLAWMTTNYGLKRAGVWVGIMLLVVVGLSYGIERPLYPKDIEPADHTHAFDTYCQPFHAGYRPSGGFAAEIWRRIRLETQLHEMVGAAMIGVLICLGLGLKRLDRRWRIEDWLNRPAPESARGAWDIVVPGPVLAGVGLLTIVAGSIVGCFAYYPPADETLDELNVAKTEALQGALSRNFSHALHWIPICQGWNRRLEVGTFLRKGQVSEYHRMKARIFRDRLEELDHIIENEDDSEVIRRQVAATSMAFGRLSRAFREE
ncbi:putative permease [Caulifigura coniformis]|uniref:Putative permease n=1 Tax=Caulifigura coniformis TaxID=2527983 RepID=A0A517SKC7_9PLAN|nr:permease [Caulifigura coniformis]QDT56582.1 putative permease [Caulifigura coniformis]